MTSMRDDGVVEFRFYRPDALNVTVSGDFNNWSPQGLPMKPLGDGWWVATAWLPDGEYRFRYVADGRWFTDYAAHGVEMGRFGWNSVLIVGDGEPQTMALAA